MYWLRSIVLILLQLTGGKSRHVVDIFPQQVWNKILKKPLRLLNFVKWLPNLSYAKFDENFELRKKKIRQKIAIWLKLNLSTIGNLIISKTFLISQLWYLLSMMDCPKNLLSEIQTDIDAFILKTNNNWISKDRIHLPPEQGGLGAIKLETYATSLRCSWYKRLKSGL